MEMNMTGTGKNAGMKHWLTIGVSAFLLAGIAIFGNGCAAIVTDQQELALGQKYQQEINSKSDVSSDPYLTQLGERLAASAPPRSVIQYHFYLVHDDELNAFALPGGNVYVNTGTIAACANASELAGVLAHEIGHVALEHHKQSISSTMGLDMLNQLVLNNSTNTSQQLAQLVEQGVLLKFSRSQETEADAEAVGTMYRAGYDPNALIRFFEKLVTRYGSGNQFFEILSSHPVTEDRIANVRALLAQLPPKGTLVQDEAGFQSFKARHAPSGVATMTTRSATTTRSNLIETRSAVSASASYPVSAPATFMVGEPGK